MSYLNNLKLKSNNYAIGTSIKKLNLNGAVYTLGLDTTDATATCGEIINGKTAYANGEKITGYIPTVELSEDTVALTCNEAIVHDMNNDGIPEICLRNLVLEPDFRSYVAYKNFAWSIFPSPDARAENIVSGKKICNLVGNHVCQQNSNIAFCAAYHDNYDDLKDVKVHELSSSYFVGHDQWYMRCLISRTYRILISIHSFWCNNNPTDCHIQVLCNRGTDEICILDITNDMIVGHGGNTFYYQTEPIVIMEGYLITVKSKNSDSSGYHVQSSIWGYLS